MRNLALIPARGGSRRIPRKNIREFAGKPIILYAATAALRSGLFERVVISTDDAEVAEVARSAGFEVPFVRPAELADDHTPMVDVVLHALAVIEETGATFDNVCTLFATAPFVRPEDLGAGYEAVRAGCPAAVAVTEFDFPIFRAFGLGDDGSLRILWPDHANTRSQDLPSTLHDAGQFYWNRVASLRSSGTLWPTGMWPVRLPRHRVQDIDTPEDWARAERLFALLADEEREQR